MQVILEEQQSMHKIWDKIFLSEDSVKVIQEKILVGIILSCIPF